MIKAQLRAHPDVLKVRWQIYAMAKKWEATLEIAAALIQLDPDVLKIECVRITN